MKYRKDWHAVMVQLTEYFSKTEFPRTINFVLKELGIETNTTRVINILREEFPDEMKSLEQNYYCMPSSSKGSIISGYFFVKYKDDIIRYIKDDLSMGEIYHILMSDPKNMSLGITRKRFMRDVHALIESSNVQEIKSTYKKIASRKHKRLEEIYKDVMRSRPYKYDVRTLCEKYGISKPTLYTFVKHSKHGKQLKKKLIYNEYENCTNRARLIRGIKNLELNGFSPKEIAKHLGVSERYVKCARRLVESMDDRISDD